ncbi:MAG: SLBB domain-containing protein [Deltaproteobacteria bacterium]
MKIYSGSLLKFILFVIVIPLLVSISYTLTAASEQSKKDNFLFAGDVLEVSVSGQSDMSEKYDIDPEGNIYMAMMGKIHVEGRDIPGLREELQNRLKKSLGKGDEISIRIFSRNRFVYIQGGVHYPGWYRAPHVTSIDYLTSISGGILPGVDLSQITIRTKTNEGFQETKAQGQIYLRSCDTLVVRATKTPKKTIDRGDVLFIKLPGNQAMSSASPAGSSLDQVRNDFSVDKNGFITIPGLIHFYVQGLTTDEASLEIEKKLPLYQTRSSRVELSILEKRHYVMVMGHVVRPGWYNPPEAATVPEVISMAGGVIDGAVMSDITIDRVNGSSHSQVKVDLYQYSINGDARILPPLHENDTIFVPISPNLGNIRRTLNPWIPPDQKMEKDTKKKITISGAVKNPGSYEPADDMNLLDLMVRAGGEVAGAELINITITRNNKKEKVNLIDIIHGNKEGSVAMPKVYSGETVYVPFMEKAWEQKKEKIYVVGGVKNQGAYDLAENMGVLQAVALAGGLDEWSDGRDIRIIRKVNGKEEHIPFNYKKAVSKKSDPSEIMLKPDDTIFVP